MELNEFLSSRFTNKMLVDGIQDNITQNDLKEYFEKYALIQEVKLFTDVNEPFSFSFVTFQSMIGCETVFMNSPHVLKGSTLRIEKIFNDLPRISDLPILNPVRTDTNYQSSSNSIGPLRRSTVKSRINPYSRSKSSRTSASNLAQFSPTPLSKIIISGLIIDTTELQLNDFFKFFGDIIDIVIMKDPLGHAFITYSEKINEELMTKVLIFNGQEIVVEIVLLNAFSSNECIPDKNARICPVCLENSEELKKSDKKFMASKCGHGICHICFDAIFLSLEFADCPVCRKELLKSDFFFIFF